jgi:UDP-glucose 4-epimerase
VPIDEKHPLDAPHPYGASKIAADRMCHAYVMTYGMDISIPRFSNIFGPRQRDIGYGGVISIFVRRVLNNMPPVIYGDGKQTRDYTYVGDAVRAFDMILSHKSRLDPINIGTGEEVSIADLASMIISLCGKKGKVTPVHVEPRIGEVKKLIADASNAKSILGWKPKYKLKDGLKSFIQWYKQFGQEERIRL